MPLGNERDRASHFGRSAMADLIGLGANMPDPRNVAHDKKVQDEKKHNGEEAVPDAITTPQPGKKPPLVQNDSPGDSYQQHAKLHPTDVPADVEE